MKDLCNQSKRPHKLQNTVFLTNWSKIGTSDNDSVHIMCIRLSSLIVGLTESKLQN